MIRICDALTRQTIKVEICGIFIESLKTHTSSAITRQNSQKIANKVQTNTLYCLDHTLLP